MEEVVYKVSFDKIIKENDLEVVYLPDIPENLYVSCTRVNRPGLQFAGFYDHYEQARLQIVGKVEFLYLSQLPEEERNSSLEKFFSLFIERLKATALSVYVQYAKIKITIQLVNAF